MKNILSLFLSLCLILGLAACGQAPQTPDARAVGSAVSALLSTAQTASEPAESLSSESPSAESSSTDSKPTAGTPSAPSAPVSSTVPASATATPSSAVTSVPAPGAPSAGPSVDTSRPSSSGAAPTALPSDTPVSAASASSVTSTVPPNDSIALPTVSDWLECWRGAPESPYAKGAFDAAQPYMRDLRQAIAKTWAEASYGKNEEPYLLVPHSDVLTSSLVQTTGQTGWVTYDFSRKGPSTEENVLATIHVAPLSAEMEARPLEKMVYQNMNGVQTGEYKGVSYAYYDGVKPAGGTGSNNTCAWFVQDHNIVVIEMYWSAAYKPWSTEYFDWFTFEKAAF